MKNKLSLLIIFFVLVLAVSACASQPQPAGYSPAIAVTPSRAEPGTTVGIVGAGFPPSTEVDIFIAMAGKEFPQQPLTTTLTDDKGQVKLTFTAPQLEQNRQNNFVVFAQTADKATFATTWLVVESQQVAQVISPTTLPAPEASPTPDAGTGQNEACQATADETMTATVASETLNVRVGPGTNYQIMTLLATGDKVVLQGRTADGAWVEVKLSDCRGGWVYAVYLKPSVSIASLPFTAGAGGPVSDNPSGAPSDGGSGIWISIENNVAYVTVKGMPANQNVTLAMSADNKSFANLASNVSNDTGAVNFKFTMPAQWGDGTAITQTNLWLTATAADGTSTRVEVIYNH